MLGQGAVVLLVTDGLDRAGAEGLPEAMERLHKSCRRLIWLNPLLRWDGFEPRSQGIRAMLPHVDEFRPVHNIASLRALIASLSRPAPARGVGAWGRYEPHDRSRRRPVRRRRMAAEGEQVAHGDGDRDMGQLAPAAGQPDGGDRVGPHGRLGQRRLHRGCGGGGGAGTIAGGPPQLLDFGVTDERAWEVGLACGGKLKVFVEALA